jgi:hypothetical protein
MKKRVTIVMLIALVIMLTASSAIANPVIYLAGDTWVEANPVKDAVQFMWRFSDKGDMWPDNQVMYCPDPLRGGCDHNVPFAPVVSEKRYQFTVPMMVISGGQSGFSLAKDGNWSDNTWLGLPDCSKLHLERNLIYYNSTPDPNIPNSGGMHILYIGPGAPFVPKADDPRIYNCAAEPAKIVSAAPAFSVLPIKNLCKVTLVGSTTRTEVLKGIIGSYWGADVKIEAGKGHNVIVTGSGGTRTVPISEKLLGQLKKLVGNPNAGDSLNSLCPEQAKLLREAIGDCN